MFNILVACAFSDLLIKIDNVNTFCACVYLESLAFKQQRPTRDNSQYISEVGTNRVFY